MPCSVNSSVAAARMRRLVSSAFLTMSASLQPTSQLTTSHSAPYVGSYQLDGYLEAGNAPRRHAHGARGADDWQTGSVRPGREPGAHAGRWSLPVRGSGGISSDTGFWASPGCGARTCP